jgi:acylphosphatase
MSAPGTSGTTSGGSGASGEAGHAGAKAVHLTISGSVQGVFYRASMREQGEHLGLSGWVRNRHDGGVEAHVQGPAAQVDALVDWCRGGPPAARVDDVAYEPATYDASLTRFGVRP